MKPLSLQSSPPREPRAASGNVVFLPRTIDKLRAELPGGDLGDYTISGLTTTMLEFLGLDLDEMRGVVERASSDDEVAAFVHERTPAIVIAAWNNDILNRVPMGGRREELILRFPWLAEQPDHSLLSLDLLLEDDRQRFQ